MKSVKRAFLGTAFMGTAFLMVLGSYNTFSVDYSAFTKNDLDIKFSKRLDNITGEIIIGRMAASVPKWDKIAEPIKKESVKIKRVAKVERVIKKQVEKIEANQSAPAIVDADLELVDGFDGKAAFAGEFSGKVVVSDGVVQTISVNIPGKGQIEFMTIQEKMSGNVFQFEDSLTSELRTGMIFKRPDGSHMVTLTNDSQFSNMRLGLKSTASEELASDIDQSESAVEEANWNNNVKQDDSYAAIVAEDTKSLIKEEPKLSEVEIEKLELQDELEELRIQNEELQERQELLRAEQEYNQQAGGDQRPQGFTFQI